MNNTTQCSSNIVMHIVLVKYEFHTEKKNCQKLTQEKSHTLTKILLSSSCVH